MSAYRHPGPHLDADRISAFTEGVLTEQERQESLAHLTDCERCRDIVFLAQQAIPAPLPQAAAVPAWRRWLPPLSLAVAAAACGLIAVVWMRPHPTPPAGPNIAATAHPIAPPSPAIAAAPPEAAPVRHAPDLDQKLIAKTPVPPPPPPGPPSVPRSAIGGIKPESGAQAPQLAARQTVPAVGSDQAQAAGAPQGSENSPLAAGPAGGAATTAQQSQKTESSLQANRAVPLAAPAPVVNGALAQAPAQNGFLTSADALNLTIEHNQGPDNGLSAIHGTVTDAAGAIIPRASITLRAGSGTLAATTTTGENGRFDLPSVAPGQYELQISAPGFRTDTERLDLQARDLALLSPALQVGAASQTVQVEASTTPTPTSAKPSDARLAEVIPELPGKLPALTTLVKSSRILALDTAGTLYLSRDAGRHWKRIRPIWTGSVAHLALMEPTEPSLKKKSPGPAAAPLFELTASDGAVWISSDGAHWRLR